MGSFPDASALLMTALTTVNYPLTDSAPQPQVSMGKHQHLGNSPPPAAALPSNTIALSSPLSSLLFCLFAFHGAGRQCNIFFPTLYGFLLAHPRCHKWQAFFLPADSYSVMFVHFLPDLHTLADDTWSTGDFSADVIN